MDSCDKIVIFGQTVQVPPNRVAYNAIRMDFIRMANEAAVQYEKLYKQDGSIQKVINGLGEQMHDCLAPTLDHCITTLIHHGVIDIDVQTFAERYDTLREQVAAPEAKNAAEDLRNAIAQSDLPDAQQEELRDTLFENENEKELKAAKKLSVISGVIVLIIVACTIAFGLKFTPALASKTVPFLGQNLVMTTQEVSNDLGYVDGLRNGVLIFGHAIVEIFVGAFYEYIGGFD